MLMLGPTRAFAAAAYPSLSLDWGQAAFGLLAAVWLAQRVVRRRLDLTTSRLLGVLLAFILVGALSLAAAADPVAGLSELVKWLEVAVLALLVQQKAREGRAGWVVALALAAGTAQAAIGLWQFGLRGSGPEHFAVEGGFYRAYGTFEQPNPFAGYLGLVWPLAAGITVGLLADLLQRRKERKELKSPVRSLGSLSSHVSLLALCTLAAILSLSALLASFSRGGWLGAGAAVSVMLAGGPRKLRHGLLLLAASGISLVFVAWSGLLPQAVVVRLQEVDEFTRFSDVRGVEITNENFALVERLAHWQAALDMARARPWLGVGLDNYENAYPEFRLLNWVLPLGHAHNVYLNVLAETGLIGLMTYVTLWGVIIGSTISALWRSAGWRRGIALGLLGGFAHLTVHNLVDNLYVNNNHLYLGTLLGLLLWLIPSTQQGFLLWGNSSKPLAQTETSSAF